MFKVINGLAPLFMGEIFPFRANANNNNLLVNTRSNTIFYNPDNPKKVGHRLENLRNLGPKLWNMLPE